MIRETLVRAFGKQLKRRDHRSTRRLRHHELLEDRRVLASISGQVIDDLNGNGEIEFGEPGLGGVGIYIDSNSNDMLDITGIIAEPDSFDADEPIEITGVTLSVQNENDVITDDEIIAIGKAPDDNVPGDFASTGDLVFGTFKAGVEGTPDSATDFFNFTQKLRMTFDDSVNSVTIDVIGSSSTAADVGVLEIYDGSNNLLASATTNGLCDSEFCESQIETLRLERSEGDITYALAYTQRERLTARFDSLRINDSGSEPWTITNSEGDYAFRELDAGTYRINQVVPSGYQQTFPNGGGDGSQQVVVAANDVSDIDFANVATVAEPPAARDDTATTFVNQAVTIDVLANDGDANTELDTTSVSVALEPTNGSAEVDALTGEITYTPTADFLGSDSLRYTVRDTNGQVSNEAIVTITVTESMPLWQNQSAPLDVDDDGFIAPIDALKVINELNEPVYRDPETGELPDPPDPIPAFFDVDGDNFVSPKDALLIINFLNELPQAAVAFSGFAEAEDDTEPAPPEFSSSVIPNFDGGNTGGFELVFLPIGTETILDLDLDAEPIAPFVEVISLTDLEQIFNLEDERNSNSPDSTTDGISLDDATAFILARNAASVFV